MTFDMYWQIFKVPVPAWAKGGEILSVVLPKKVADAMAKEEAEKMECEVVDARWTNGKFLHAHILACMHARTHAHVNMNVHAHI